jgi:hypothetical protein
MLPFDRTRLRERNQRDQEADRADAAAHTPAERLEQAVELSELILALSRAAGSDTTVPATDLAEKARLYAYPLRILASAR